MSYLFASAKGWAGGARKTAIPDFPGSKAIRVQMGLILYSDVYWTCPGSEQSFGVTIMSAYDIARVTWIPLWHMQYGGRYPERMIAFLKTALRQTYNAGEFVGGRGPREFSQGGDIFYINDPDPEKNDFREFRGEERILEGGARVGSHWYRGGLLIPET
ncbi:MAG: DUF5680 domain-containing protein [Candidatus Wildermuthbacteria bacterium]|nr:DUF5680 domain-containing protein [Candidatus Wildermuthbacteria bacterium]